MTPEKIVLISKKSADVCRELGITGRVFANEKAAVAMTEGPHAAVQGYRAAIEVDPLIETFLLQTEREIDVREFRDYSVWLNIPQEFAETDSVRWLTLDTVGSALPKNASARLRLIAMAYLDRAMLAA